MIPWSAAPRGAALEGVRKVGCDLPQGQAVAQEDAVGVLRGHVSGRGTDTSNSSLTDPCGPMTTDPLAQWVDAG